MWLYMRIIYKIDLFTKDGNFLLICHIWLLNMLEETPNHFIISVFTKKETILMVLTCL